MKVILFFLLVAVSAHAIDTQSRRSKLAFCGRVSAAAGDRMFEMLTAESEFLSQAQLPLVDARGVEAWERKMNDFCAARRNRPEISDILESFVVEYSSHPPGGVLPGDWPVVRPISSMREFFLQSPHHIVRQVALDRYELKPVESGTTDNPRIVDQGSLPAGRLYDVVIRDLQNRYTYLKEVKGTDSEEKVAELRITYLRITLLKEAYLQWQKEQRSN